MDSIDMYHGMKSMKRSHISQEFTLCLRALSEVRVGMLYFMQHVTQQDSTIISYELPSMFHVVITIYASWSRYTVGTARFLTLFYCSVTLQNLLYENKVIYIYIHENCGALIEFWSLLFEKRAGVQTQHIPSKLDPGT